MEKVYRDAPVVLAGDFNTTLDAERTLREILSGGFRSTAEGIPFSAGITHPGSGHYPSISFDHINLAAFWFGKKSSSNKSLFRAYT